ncbi:GNAT family N-acetyltransferase [bacterium]|nr:GNAT family N-acetyltransferase [bacterium]
MISFYGNLKKALIKDSESKLVLRKIVQSDIEILKGWMKDRELLRISFGIKEGDGPDYEVLAKDYLRLVSNPNGACRFLALCDDKLEMLGLLKYDLRIVEGIGIVALAGIMLGRLDLVGKGLGTQGMRLFLRWLFEGEYINLVEVETSDYNLRAQRCFTKVGFEVCDKCYSLEGIVGYGSAYDAPKIYMKFPLSKYLQIKRGEL